MIHTQLSGFSKLTKQARNSTLMPEVRLRSKRILKGAAQELSNSLSFYPKTVELYKRLTNGRACSCTKKKAEVAIEDTNSLFLSDFVLTFDGKLNETLDECPICFGTGFAGGYSRSGCYQIVLDSTLTNTSTLEQTLDPPYYFKPSNKTKNVSWNVTLPKYFSKIVNVAIRWKEEPEQWSFTVDNNEYSNSYLVSRKGETVTFKMTMKDNTNKNAGMYCIFIQLAITNELVQADMPRITTSYTGEMNISDEPQNNITINLGNVGKLSTKDVVIDDLGYIWRILEIESLNPMNVEMGYTCQARLCRNFENYFILPSKMINKLYTHSYVFVS